MLLCYATQIHLNYNTAGFGICSAISNIYLQQVNENQEYKNEVKKEKVWQYNTGKMRTNTRTTTVWLMGDESATLLNDQDYLRQQKNIENS